MKQFTLIKSKKAQIWSIDLVVAGVIFLIGIVVLFYYALNYSTQSKNQLDELFYEGNLASELILSDEEGGILSAGIVNDTKLNYFDSLSDSDKRNLLGLRNNFYFIMDGLDIGGRNYIGMMNTSSVDNLIQITRLTIYKNKPIKFKLFVWK